MNNYEKLSDKLFDEMLEQAAFEVEMEESEKLQEPEIEVEYSAEHNRKMKKLFRKVNKKGKAGKFVPFSKVAVILLLISAFSVGIGSSDVRAKLMQFFNFVFRADRPNSDYNFSDLGGTYYSDDNIILEYLPTGFELTEMTDGIRNYSWRFEYGENYVNINKNNLDTGFSIDTEDGTVEELTINGNKAFYIETKIVHALIWRDEEFAYRISGNINQNEIVKIGKYLLK